MPRVKLFTHIYQNASFVWGHTFMYNVHVLGHCWGPSVYRTTNGSHPDQVNNAPPPAHGCVLYLYLSYHSVNIPTSPFYYNQLIKVCSDLTSTLLA